MKTPLDLSKASIYEQLAEEAIELAHAAQKMARKLRDENPTPVMIDYISKALSEEYSDVINVADFLDLHADSDLIREKNRRWIERLNDQN